MLSLCILIFLCSPVMPSDVQTIEKRLLQTMDMILAKKKRIALAKKCSVINGTQSNQSNSGIWSMLKTVTSVNKNGGESILVC